jgi:hypothetical protein
MNFKLNTTIFIGRISNDVNFNVTIKSGKKVGNISVALNVSGARTLFVDITAWDDAAKIVPKLQKGDLVYVEGRLDLDYKDDKKFIITAEEIRLVHSKWLDKLGRSNKDLEDMFTIDEIKKLMEDENE